MPKQPQPKGGRLPTGEPAKSDNVKRNAGHALTAEVREAIDSLPQVKSGEWSKSYLAEQLWRNYLGMPADYDWSDLEIIAQRHTLA